MDHFAYRDRTLFCEDVPVPELAGTYGTPLYVYSQATLLHHLKQIQTAFAPADPVIATGEPSIALGISTRLPSPATQRSRS